jgi:hypothetical protein
LIAVLKGRQSVIGGSPVQVRFYSTRTSSACAARSDSTTTSGDWKRGYGQGS